MDEFLAEQLRGRGTQRRWDFEEVDTEETLREIDSLNRYEDDRARFIKEGLKMLESQDEIDIAPVLDQLVYLSQEFSTEDVLRALQRERKLMQARERGHHEQGRPSKVEPLVNGIRLVVESEEIDDEERLMLEKLSAADISESTYYKVRRHVLEEVDIDLNEIDRAKGAALRSV